MRLKSPLPPFAKGGTEIAPFTKGGRAQRGGIFASPCTGGSASQPYLSEESSCPYGAPLTMKRP
jgi:hypothetical protein